MILPWRVEAVRTRFDDGPSGPRPARHGDRERLAESVDVGVLAERGAHPHASRRAPGRPPRRSGSQLRTVFSPQSSRHIRLVAGPELYKRSAMDSTKTLPRSMPTRVPGRPALVACVVAGRLARASTGLGEEVSVGRDAAATLAVDDPSMSRRHFSVRRTAKTDWTIEDLASRNGTFVDRVEVKGPTPARIGSVIRAGASIFVIVADAHDARTAVRNEHGLVGGASLSGVRRAISTYGPTRTPTLILGETGTGKEVVARALHESSARRGPFVPVNCAALPHALFESELFGHARGAYSGAGTARPGLVRSAQAGSLFLDEIGELPLELQPKLLRFLEDGIVRAVGDDAGKTVDVRVIAATHQALTERVDEGRFREDLLQRLRAGVIELPPLADRREDIPALVEHLLAGLPGEPTCSTDALELLVSATWRGNVRELRNVLQAATHQASGAGEREIAVTHLPSELLRARQSVGLARVSPAAALEPESGIEDAAPDDEAPSSTLATDDLSRRDAIAAALAASRGNVTEAATRLNMRRATVYELMRRFGLDPRRYR